MKIVVTHLTRMSAGSICVAGIDTETRSNVRPILRFGQLSKDLLARNGGPFDIANIVDLGVVDPCPAPPKLEDHFFKQENARKLSVISNMDLNQLLTDCSSKSLKEIFGEQLQPSTNTAFMSPGNGKGSLGYLLPKPKPYLYVEEAGGKKKVKMRFADEDQSYSTGVTDIRLFMPDHRTVNLEEVRRINELLANGGRVFLGVGLTYPWSSDPEKYPAVHWVQVNAVHLPNDLIRPLN